MFRKTYVQVNLENIKENIARIGRNLPESCGIIAVVKANAYGHGAVWVSQAALEAGACALAVALPEEAVELREAGITCPILVMTHANPEQLVVSCLLDLEQGVSEPEDILFLNELAARENKKLNVHLKVDTGMGRIGIRSLEELHDMLEAFNNCPNICFKGVFTHFSCSDDADNHYTRRQAEHFETYLAEIHAAGYKPEIHAANSASSIDMPQYAYDMVRLGISMYGYYPSQDMEKKVELLPAMEVVAEISAVKTVPAGESIGYGATYKTDKETRVATVQIGYGDGYPRLLSNKGSMLVENDGSAHEAPIIGRVCMDQTMIDITGLHDIKIGDRAVVMGTLHDKCITAEDIAKWADTISYEIVLGFSSRVPRVHESE
ncbi:MAG: alanine racemase [Christensenellaceae bacterium]